MADEKESITVKEELNESNDEDVHEDSWSIDDFDSSVKHEEALLFANYFIKGWDKETGSVLLNIFAGAFCLVSSLVLLIFIQGNIIRTILIAAIVSEELDEIPSWVDLVLNIMTSLSILIFFVGCYYLIIGYLHYRKFSVAKEYMLKTNINLRSKIKQN